MIPTKVLVGSVSLDSITECDLVGLVRKAWTSGDGGTIVTVNADIARKAADHRPSAELIASATFVVADGMPLLWAARVNGEALPERVTGSSLIYSLSAAAARDGRSVFILGGAFGISDAAAANLSARWPALRVVGASSPPFGFDEAEEGIQETIFSVIETKPDLVFVGLGFPRQELLIERLRTALPEAWFLGCGGAISMAADVLPRACPLVQRLGLEWMHRLLLEPRRLAARYLRDDMPFVIRLLTRATMRRVCGKARGRCKK